MMSSRGRALVKDANICRGPEQVKLKGFARQVEVYTIYPELIKE